MELNLLSLYGVTNVSDTILTLQKLINLMTIVTAFCSSGTGKTTLLIHLAYYCALQGIETALIELDNRNSLHTCGGLPESDFDTSSLFSPDFTGDYSLLPLWKDNLKGKASVCQAKRDRLLTTEQFLSSKPLGVLKLKQVLQKYPLSHSLILLDSPGQEGVMSSSAILASDYVILSIEPTSKAMNDAIRFVQILYEYEEEYGVDVPEILGIVVGLYNHEESISRNIMSQLPEIADKIGTRLFSPIRYSSEFRNAYSLGLALNMYRSGHEAVKDFFIDGNLFKGMNDKKFRGLDRDLFKNLPAIGNTLVHLIKEQHG